MSKSISSCNKEAVQIINYQAEVISKLKKEKSHMEAYALDLETQIRELASLPAALKEKEKTIKGLRKAIKMFKEKKPRIKKSGQKISYSHRNTPRIANESMKFEKGLLSCRHQSSKTISTVPMSTRNSQSSLFPLTLHDVLIKTEDTLKKWQQYYISNSRTNF